MEDSCIPVVVMRRRDYKAEFPRGSFRMKGADLADDSTGRGWLDGSLHLCRFMAAKCTQIPFRAIKSLESSRSHGRRRGTGTPDSTSRLGQDNLSVVSAMLIYTLCETNLPPALTRKILSLRPFKLGKRG